MTRHSLPATRLRPAPDPARDHVRPGLDASPELTARRVARLLDAEPVVWLATIQPNGLPHLVPTWFWWNGETLLVFSKPEARKVASMRSNPRLMVAVGHPEEDFDVVLLEAQAHVCRHRVEVPDAFFEKYADQLAEGRLDRPTFRSTYTQPIVITPTRLLPWRGRGPLHDLPRDDERHGKRNVRTHEERPQPGERPREERDPMGWPRLRSPLPAWA
jgi:PPOX class probable F420-dependent enzyme